MRLRFATLLLAASLGAFLLPGTARSEEAGGAPSRSGIESLGGGLGSLTSGLKGLKLPTGDGANLPVKLDADTLTFDEETGVALAQGHVVVTAGTRTIEAEKIRYDSRTQEAEFEGKVRFRNEGDDFSFDRIVLNIATEQGILYNGTIHLATNNYTISSERIEKTGPLTFFIRKGSLTTCDCDPIPDWEFEVGRSRVTIDGYAVAKDVKFKIRDVPVLWLPWGAFPVKTTRQSGLLMPGYVNSRTTGNGVSIPYYQVVNRWSDATLTLDAMDRRGLKIDGEYRFVLNQASEGLVRGAFLRDRLTGYALSRFYGENRFRYGQWTANGRWDVASDAVYYRDFVEEDLLRTARHVPSRAFVGNDGESTHASISASWGKDIQEIPGADNTLQRIPEIAFTRLPARIGGDAAAIDAQGSAHAAWLYRRGGEREGRGRADIELSRTFTLYPSVFLTPFAGADALESFRSGGEPRAGRSDGGRILPMAGAQLSATAWRYFSTPSGATLVHSLNPSVRYRWVPTVSQDDIPTTDRWSRIEGRNQVAISVSQGLHRIGKGGVPVDLASLDLEWAYDIGNRRISDSPYVDPLSPFVWTLRDQIDLNAGRPRNVHSASDILARLRVSPAPGWNATGEALFDPNDRRLTRALAGGEWRADEDNRAALQYAISRQLSEDVLAWYAWRPFRLVGISGSANYSIRNKELTEGTAKIDLYPRSDCWNVGVIVRRTTLPEDTSVRFVFALKGIGGVGN